MKFKISIIFSFYFLLFTFSNSNHANESCVNIIANVSNNQNLIDKGTFRAHFTRNKNTDLNFDYDAQTPFADYLTFAKKHIIQSNPRALIKCDKYKTSMFNNLSAPLEPNVVNLIAPYELSHKGNDKVIVLIHGLTDTPYHFHDLSEKFYDMGFDVRTLLLPGHATTAHELSKISYKDWQLATRYIIENSKNKYSEVLLGGFSTGGALIFDYLKNNKKNDKIKAALFWSLGSEAKSSSAKYTPYLNYVPFLTWVDKAADTDFAKYESFPMNAAAQFYNLSEHVTELLDEPFNSAFDIPFYAVSSDVDNTINSETSYKLFAKWQQQSNAKKSVITRYNTNSTTNSKGTVCASAINCKRVLDISHTGIMNSYNNPLYGLSSVYRNCVHYLGEPKLYASCLKTDTFGENHKKNLHDFATINKTMARLTFNPHFDQMFSDIKQFLQNNALLN